METESMAIETPEDYGTLTEYGALTDIDAEHFLRVIREANSEFDRMQSWYLAKIEEAQAARDERVRYAESALRVFFESVPAKETKTQKSYELPGGKLVLKRQEPKFETHDETLVPWLKANKPEFVKMKVYSDWAGLKKELKLAPDGVTLVTEDGEVVPGIDVTPRDDKFVVTVK